MEPFEVIKKISDELKCTLRVNLEVGGNQRHKVNGVSDVMKACSY